MAEWERTGLLIEHGWLHAVKLAGGREGTPAPTARSWAAGTPPAPASVGEESSASAGSLSPGESPPPWREALHEARRTLKIEAGCALALPTHDLLIKVLKLPPTDASSLGGMARLQMEKVAPCVGEELSVGYEVLAQEETGARVLAAAVPQAYLNGLADDLRDAGLRLTRLDAALLGWWRQVEALALPGVAQGTCVVLFEQGGSWDFVLARQGEIVQARGFGRLLEAADLGRELTLTLLNHEMEAGPTALDALLVVSESTPGAPWMASLASAADGRATPQWLPRERLGAPGLGVALREGEAGRLDLVPPAWRRLEYEQRRRRLARSGLAAAVALWVVLAGILFGSPYALQRQNAGLTERIAAGETAYRAVSDVRQRVRLIRSYMDRSESLLEVLREVCLMLPEGIVFGSVTYRRADALKLAGDADQSSRVYALKDALDASGRFESTRLTGPTLDGARRRYRFEIDARFKGDGE
jgi:Tfp pilus assembly protein PilN